MTDPMTHQAQTAAVKLSKPQKRCLADIASGKVYRLFDVWGGYKWQNGDHFTSWRKTKFSAPSPIATLERLQLVELVDDKRGSGWRAEKYIPTNLGRSLLSQTEG